MKPLFITDLDGTLLDRGSRLSSVTVGILKALLEDGAPVTIATGRSLPSVRDLMGSVMPELPVIVHNGARIADPKTGEYLYSNFMDSAMLDDVLALAFSEHFSPFLNGVQEDRDYFLYAPPGNLETEDYIRYRERIMETGAVRPFRFRNEMEGYGIINLNIIHPLSELESFEGLLRERIPEIDVHITTDSAAPDIGWLTVGDQRSHKAQAIQRIQELIPGGPFHVTVFGDQINDVPMFQVAHRAVAVENADLRLLEIAHEVIGPHWEDSVAKYMAKEWIRIHETTMT